MSKKSVLALLGGIVAGAVVFKAVSETAREADRRRAVQTRFWAWLNGLPLQPERLDEETKN